MAQQPETRKDSSSEGSATFLGSETILTLNDM